MTRTGFIVLSCLVNQALLFLKAVLVPRLELSAATVSVGQDKMLKGELEMPLNSESVCFGQTACQYFVM